LTIAHCPKLKTVPASIGRMTSLESLTINYLPELKTLPAEIGQLGTLKQLTIQSLDMEAMPDTLGRMTSLQSLTLDCCDKLKTVPASIGQLGTLTQLTIRCLDKLEAMPHTLGRMTSLESLTIAYCPELKTVPASIGQLGTLKQLTLVYCPLQDMPCIEALTALRTLELAVTDYTLGSHAFMALSRSLPCLQQLEKMYLRGFAEPDQNGYRDHMDVRAEDVLAVGRALRAWPLPLLHHVEDGMGLSLRACWQALGLPAAAAGWSNATTLEFFRVQQHKMAAFASGMHARLGAASEVSRLDEQTLVMIADEVLGGWGLLREWRQPEGAGAGGGSC